MHFVPIIQVSDTLRGMHERKPAQTMHSDAISFNSMRTSLLLTTFVIALSGGLFLYGSLYVNEDAAKTKATMKSSPMPKKEQVNQLVVP